MSKHLVGITGSVAAALAGVWLVAAPTALSYQPQQPPEAAWTDATTVSILTGAGLIAVGLIAAAAFAAALVAELRQRRVLPERRPPARHVPAAQHAPADDLDAVLGPLAAALMEDLQTRRALGATSLRDEVARDHAVRSPRS